MSGTTREPWESLFISAMSLIDQVLDNGQSSWSFGGGTVLMFHLNHRKSKDIDLFLDDPQVLGLFSPRLSDLALALTPSYSESLGSLKLLLPEGEIDFIVAKPLTSDPYEFGEVLGRQIRLETPAEIIAKKLWHRGHSATGRDLFDLAAVASSDAQLLRGANIAMAKNAKIFLDQCRTRERVVRAQYEAVDVLDFQLTFAESLKIAEHVLRPLIV